MCVHINTSLSRRKACAPKNSRSFNSVHRQAQDFILASVCKRQVKSLNDFLCSSLDFIPLRISVFGIQMHLENEYITYFLINRNKEFWSICKISVVLLTFKIQRQNINLLFKYVWQAVLKNWILAQLVRDFLVFYQVTTIIPLLTRGRPCVTPRAK
jgi:hypothetical protein